MADTVLVYVILGAPGSGRREVLVDLLADESPGDTAVLLSAEEPSKPVDEKLGKVTRWTWNDEDKYMSCVLPPGAKTVFFVTDGRKNPVDQVEALKPWLEGQGAELARILTVVDCALASEHPPLMGWYEACIHFSDVVLLNHREGVANKWMSDFKRHFEELCYPCLFEFVKEGRIKNPALILSPEPRRMSHAFEDEPEWIVIGEEGEEEDEESSEKEGEEEVEVTQEEDPYFARRLGGRRVKEITDINKHLPEGR